MEAAFWHERWEKTEIGFHEGAANRHLTTHFAGLGLAAGARVFVPLCGKTRDIAWLLSHGYRVVGAELSEIAVRELFQELGAEPEIRSIGALKRYAAEGVEIYVGDVFALDAATLGPVDAVHDRAALVALPPAMRARYAAHLAAITGSALQFLITFAYDQSVMPGPPFSVEGEAVTALYGALYTIKQLEKAEVEGGLKGRCPAVEEVWHLTPR